MNNNKKGTNTLMFETYNFRPRTDKPTPTQIKNDVYCKNNTSLQSSFTI